MTETGDLALAGMAAGFLAELRADPVRAVEGIQLTLSQQRGGGSAVFAKLAMDWSEYRGMAEPDDPEAKAWRPCGSPDASRVRILQDGSEVRVPRVPEPGAAALERLCEKHREALAGATSLQAELPGGDEPGGPCQFPVKSEAPGAFCDWCGATTGLEDGDDLGTGDIPCTCHGMLTRPCRDTDACCRRREEKFPPDLSRVPSWVLTAGSEAAAAAEIASLVRLAAGQAAREYLELAQPPQDELEVELAGQPAALRGWQSGWKTTPGGVWDTRGDFIPQVINWSHIHWSHTIRGGAHMGHTIAGGARIGGNRAPGALSGPQQPPGQPGTSVPPARQNGPDGRQDAYQAARGVTGPPTADVPMGQVEAVAHAAAQAAASQPRRRGRRALRYSPRRPAVRRKPQPQHPGVDGSDSFHGGGMDTGGPSGGGSET